MSLGARWHEAHTTTKLSELVTACDESSRGWRLYLEASLYILHRPRSCRNPSCFYRARCQNDEHVRNSHGIRHTEHRKELVSDKYAGHIFWEIDVADSPAYPTAIEEG